jgi:NADPH:quinone reductase-like Zn-dependent oxidoreductase
VTKLGHGVRGGKVGDEVIGFTDKWASHAEHVVAEAGNLTLKPTAVSWEVAGSLAIAGSTACAAVRAVSLKPGDVVAVSGAAGGVGSIAVQLAKRAGAKVIGIASPANHAWLTSHGVEAVAYGEGLADRLRMASLNAFIDCHGAGYVKLAIELRVPKDRIDTIIDFAAAKEYGVKTEGSQQAKNAEVLAELARLVAEGKLDVPVAATFPLTDVRAAFRHRAGSMTLTAGRIINK